MPHCECGAFVPYENLKDHRCDEGVTDEEKPSEEETEPEEKGPAEDFSGDDPFRPTRGSGAPCLEEILAWQRLK